MKRRSFLKVVGGTVVTGATVAHQAQSGEVTEKVVNGFPRRRLGRTGEMITTVGFPGLALRNYSQDEGTAKIHQTFERGLNYYDVAPAYGKDGECEIKMGIGMEGIDRDQIFLSCKTQDRDVDLPLDELLPLLDAAVANEYLPRHLLRQSVEVALIRADHVCPLSKVKRNPQAARRCQQILERLDGL